jgi:hypothetical protein
MFDESKRQEELKVLMDKIEIKLLSPIWFRYQIISQEKEMIEQLEQQNKQLLKQIEQKDEVIKAAIEWRQENNGYRLPHGRKVIITEDEELIKVIDKYMENNK